jgi:NAD(P)-dependent dehydrogenase (short-subunit alcohol dehydrogenase family)
VAVILPKLVIRHLHRVCYASIRYSDESCLYKATRMPKECNRTQIGESTLDRLAYSLERGHPARRGLPLFVHGLRGLACKLPLLPGEIPCSYYDSRVTRGTGVAPPLNMPNKSKKETSQKTLPAQHQNQRPGIQARMKPQPKSIISSYKGTGKLSGRVAIVTGGDSGIGRAVAQLFAREGADVIISYLNEHVDARATKALVEAEGRQCILFPGDTGQESICKQLVKSAMSHFGRIDIVVNNAAEQHPQKSLLTLSAKQLERTFRTNIFSYFHLSKAALPHLKKGSAIINTTSVTAYRGSAHLLDYSSTKGAIVSFTRSLAAQLAPKQIRVNGVAPGPIWTPLIPSTFPAKKVAKFGGDVPLGRPGQPEEVAPCYVFLAGKDSSYMTGQILHPNGGEIING